MAVAVALVGMTLGASPPRVDPNTTDSSAGAASSATRSGTSVSTRPSTASRLTVNSGRAVWPPGPKIVMRTMSAAEVIAPTRRATWPTSIFGSQ